MKYFGLIWAGLWRKKARTLLTIFSIVTAFFLFGMLQGINLGIDQVVNQFLGTTRLRVVDRSGTNHPFPVAHASRIASLPDVAAITPLSVLPGMYQDRSSIIIGLAVDMSNWMTIYPEFLVSKQQLETTLRTRNGAMVGIATAERYGWKLGDHIPISAFGVQNSDGTTKWEFEVTGIYEIKDAHDFSTNVLLNYDYLNEARLADKNTAIQMIVRIRDPDKSAVVASEIDELFANSANQTLTQNEKDFVQSTLAQIGDIGFFVNGIVGAVLFTLLFLTANTMMQSVRERTPEIAVLKTLGFSDSKLLVFVLCEALILSFFAGALGLLAAKLVFPILMQTAGSFANMEGLRIPFIVFAWGAVIAVVLALVSGLPPAWRARQLKIVDALAGR
jgi:putative ABC transport system permease protein